MNNEADVLVITEWKYFELTHEIGFKFIFKSYLKVNYKA
jgi:hypothetical protein